MKRLLLILVLIASTMLSFAQARFISKGKIEYEKKVNLHRQMEGDWEDFKKEIPQFYYANFDLIFDGQKSIYKPGKEANNPAGSRNWTGPASENIVYTDLESGIRISSKQVFEETFLLNLKTGKNEWKVQSETREIAGFQCRKAMTKIMDSVYVVAFYTDEILFEGGPESFDGLPGTILGLAVPRLYTTWFATKVTVENINVQEIAPPQKGKKMDEPQLAVTLQKAMKDWGKWGERFKWQIAL